MNLAVGVAKVISLNITNRCSHICLPGWKQVCLAGVKGIFKVKEMLSTYSSSAKHTPNHTDWWQMCTCSCPRFLPILPSIRPPPHRWRGPSADGECMQETGRCLGLWPSHLASSLPCSLHLPLLPFSEVILGLNTAQVALVQKNIFSWLQIMQNSLLLTDPRVRIIHFPELTGFHTKSLSQDTCFKWSHTSSKYVCVAQFLLEKPTNAT